MNDALTAREAIAWRRARAKREPLSEDAGAEAGSRIEFAENLEKLGFAPDRAAGGRRIWRGVCLRAAETVQ